MVFRRRLLVSLLLISICTIARADVAPSKSYFLHLPGIAGIMRVDRAMERGLVDGGFDGDIESYDWTENDRGIRALQAYERNHKEAKIIADKIVARHNADPAAKIFLSCHSGGGGLAVWALEYLPDGVMVDDLLLFSPALSPEYDLTKALQHVRGKAYVFSSMLDVFVLGTGTKMFGTIDGIKTDAAGRVGFTRPATADAEQYKKLVPMPFDPSWVQFHDMGDHIGGMTQLFGEHVIVPLILKGQMPPTSMPTTAESSAEIK